MSKELEILKRRLQREISARKEAERVLEEKSLELYHANEKLLGINQNLEKEVNSRSRKLAESEKNYRQLVENVADIIYRATPDGKFTFVNGVAIEKTGYTENELLNMRYIDLIRSDYKLEAASFYQGQLNKKVDKTYFEFPIITKHERTIWIGQNVQFIFENDKVVEVFAIARDISDFKYAHEQLILSEEKYRSIIENLDLGLLETDTDGIVTKAYPKFTELTGYSEKELIGKDPKSILLKNHLDISKVKEQENVRIDGKASAYESPIYKKNGDKIWVIISAAPILNRDGQVSGTIGVHFDISERKKIEEELLRARSDADSARKAEQLFLANMSHEIRTPLNSVIGMSHLLYDLSSTQEQIDYLNALQHSAELLKSIINDILDISKIEAGKLEYNESSFVLSNLVTSLAKTLQLKIEQKNVDVEVEVDHRLNDKRVLGDNLLLNQILLNLLGNAEKFTQKGQIKLIANVLGVDDDYFDIEFKVCDTGIGIEEERLKSVFEKYEQASTDTKMKYGGTGLGLAITQKLVTFLGGEIYVDSEYGSGTEFTVKMRFKQAPELEEAVKTSVKKENIKAYNNLLVAEDNAMNRKYVYEVFKNSSLEVDFANNGQIAVDMCLKKRYDLILMDLQMPVKDGFEATIEIRTLENKNRKTPIIGLSAYATEDVKNKCRLAGMESFESKPITPKQLRSLLNIEEQVKLVKNVQVELDLLDRELLEELYFGDIDYAFEMFNHFIGVVDEQIAEFKEAYYQGDLKETRRLIHKMKPGFSMVGVPKLQEIGTLIENDANSGNIDRLKKNTELFFNCFDTNIEAVKKEHKRLEELKMRNE